MPQSRYHVGDILWIVHHRATFQKSYESGGTEEIFEIWELVSREISVYKIGDLAGEPIKGSFNEVQQLDNGYREVMIDSVLRIQTKMQTPPITGIAE